MEGLGMITGTDDRCEALNMAKRSPVDIDRFQPIGYFCEGIARVSPKVAGWNRLQVSCGVRVLTWSPLYHCPVEYENLLGFHFITVLWSMSYYWASTLSLSYEV